MYFIQLQFEINLIFIWSCSITLSCLRECDISSQCDWSYIRCRLGSCLHHNHYIWTISFFL